MKVNEGDLPETSFVYDTAASDDTLRALIAQRFLVPMDQDENALYEGTIRVLRTLRQRGRLRTYTILPTTACNARCVYCFEADMRVETMSSRTVEDTIAFILQSHDPDRRIRLRWFGGEPLLAAGIIDRICAALIANDVSFESGMITNGSLIDAAMAERMANAWRMTSVQLSMDCAEREYILRKRYLVYHDEYNTVMAAVNLLTDRGIEVTVRCNVDEDNITEMDTFIQDLVRMIPDKTLVSVYFQPLYEMRQLKSSDRVWAACTAVEQRIRDAGFTVKHGSRVRHLRIVSCMAESPYESVVISPDGTLYNCEHCPEANALGTVREGVMDHMLQERLAEVEPTRESCLGCVFLPECMTFTGCPVRSAICKKHRRAWLDSALLNEVTLAESGDASVTDQSGPLSQC
ncbi:MAG: radical SAM protein [Clostridia bacterium]|nr:radical SAM protein [Clostridia bacterium]